MSNLGNDTDNCPEIPDKEDSEGNWVGDVMTIAAVVRFSYYYDNKYFYVNIVFLSFELSFFLFRTHDVNL